jgi:uncharacterized protein YwqG
MQHIDKLLHEHELYHKRSEIISSLKNSIRLEKVEVDEDAIPIGSSKLGGLPDLPDEMEFPRYEKGVLCFMGQINLKEAKPYDKDNLFPESGILYLFYDAYEQPWGFEEDEGCYKVLFFDGDTTELKRREYPDESNDDYPLNTYKVLFKNMYTYPNTLKI